MPAPIRPDHPLRRFFAELIDRHLVHAAQLSDRQISSYVGDVLVDFCHADHLYRIRDAQGRRLEDVAEMLIASNPLLGGKSFFYEREVRKHIGDYTLFLAGLFPEHLARIGRQGRRLDSLVDYLKAGKESYRVVAAFDQFEFRQQAPLFRRLSEQFELCVYGLNLMKQALSEQRDPLYRQMRQIIG